MPTIQRFEDIEAWQSARRLRREVYQLTRLRNFAQDGALVSQIRRASISVTSNIAEGFSREGNREFIQFLSQAKGSTSEVKDQLYVALDENYISQLQFDTASALVEDTAKLIGGFMSYLRRAEIRGSKFKVAESQV